MDRNAAGLYGSLLWTVGSALGSVLGIYLIIANFQTSFQAGAEAARTGVPLTMEAATESTLRIFGSLQPVLILNGILVGVGSVLLLMGLDGLRRRMPGALGAATLLVGFAYVAVLLASSGVDALVGMEARLRSSLGGGFGPYLALGIGGAVIMFLFPLLVGVFVFTYRRALPHPAKEAGILLILGFIPFVQPVGSFLLARVFHRLRRSPLPAGETAAVLEPVPSPSKEGPTGGGPGSRLHALGLCGSLVLAFGSALAVILFFYTIVLSFTAGLQLGHQIAQANQSGHPLSPETIATLSPETIANMRRETVLPSFSPFQSPLWAAAWAIWTVGMALLLVGLVGLWKKFPGALLPIVFALGLSTLIPFLGFLLGIIFNVLLGAFLLEHRRRLPGPALAAGILFILFFIPFVTSAAFACLAGIFYRLRTGSTAAAVPSPASAPPPPDKRFCTQCGSPLAAETRFCGSCGARV